MSALALCRWAGFARWTIFVSGALALSAARDGWAETASACRFEPIATATVAHVLDGRTFTLTDGREVRLAGIEVPELPELKRPTIATPPSAAEPSEGPEVDADQLADPAGAADSPLPVPPASSSAGPQARSALALLLADRDVLLKRLGASSDRYGRVVAHVFAFSEAGERWIQAELVASGYARVSPRLKRACAKELFAREAIARTAKLGAWAEPFYEAARAEDHMAVGVRRGQFALVEGKVLSVRESGGTIYVNFGRRWSEDFTVTIAKRNERAFTAAGIEPKRLQGRFVRVRGWIEERGGPWIDAVRPQQIEVVEK